MRTVIRVPATTANLGPGFDCLGLALDLWNEFTFDMLPDGVGQSVEIEGFGAGSLPADRTNLVLGAFNAVCERLGSTPPGVRVQARHRFPIGSGLGSSASAIAAGVQAAARFFGAGRIDPLAVAVGLEGHPDNVSAAILGGLTVSLVGSSPPVSVRTPVASGWRVGVVVPDLAVTTAAMRAALPRTVPFEDAVFNLGRTALVVQALARGDPALLRSAMADRLHQPARLALIPGAAAALESAWEAGTAAALSGAGPGLIAFAAAPEPVREAVRGMEKVFIGEGIGTWSWEGGISEGGSEEVTVTGGSDSHLGE